MIADALVTPHAPVTLEKTSMSAEIDVRLVPTGASAAILAQRPSVPAAPTVPFIRTRRAQLGRAAKALVPLTVPIVESWPTQVILKRLVIQQQLRRWQL